VLEVDFDTEQRRLLFWLATDAVVQVHAGVDFDLSRKVSAVEGKIQSLLLSNVPLRLTSEEAETLRDLLIRGCELNAAVLAVLPDRHETARRLYDALSDETAEFAGG
jgi:hypothetical protein